MEELLCLINPLSDSQFIYQINTDTLKKIPLMVCPYHELPDRLDFLMHDKNIYVLHFAGHDDYITEIASKIPTEFTLKKDLFNLKITHNIS